MREKRGDRDSDRDNYRATDPDSPLESDPRPAETTPQSADQARAVLADVLLERRRKLFELSGNGVHVVAAHRRARNLRVPVPEWATAARDRSDEALLSARSVKDVAPAMGLHANGGPFAVERAENDERNLAIFDMVEHFKAWLKAPADERDLSVFPERVRKELEKTRVAHAARRKELELDGLFAVVGRRFELEADNVEKIYYAVKRLKASPRPG